jgi:uncharacterized protein YigE (DUF2233 family)
MKYGLKIIFIAACAVSLTGIFVFGKVNQVEDDRFITYTADCKKQNVSMFWKDEQGTNFSSIGNLRAWLEKNHRKLSFAMNGGMYQPDHSPKGLFIENGVPKAPLDTSSGEGNFYIKPNGVFYITDSRVPVICDTKAFQHNGGIKYATQSGPMLVINGQIGAVFKQGSTNLNIRNGVGCLPNGNVIFVLSKVPVNFFDFAAYFKSLGCKNALYLDGFVSRAYIPGKNWQQTDGDFGVIIGVTAAE